MNVVVVPDLFPLHYSERVQSGLTIINFYEIALCLLLLSPSSTRDIEQALIQPATPKVQGETPEGTVIDSILKSVIA